MVLSLGQNQDSHSGPCSPQTPPLNPLGQLSPSRRLLTTSGPALGDGDKPQGGTDTRAAPSSTVTHRAGGSRSEN